MNRIARLAQLTPLAPVALGDPWGKLYHRRGRTHPYPFLLHMLLGAQQKVTNCILVLKSGTGNNTKN